MPYTTPTLTDFRMRFPEFGDVPDDRVSYWLADAIPRVGDNWTEQDRAPATLLLVAHNLAASGALASEGDIPTGVTSLRSGSLSITMDAAYVAASSEGGYAGTKYGREFARLTRLNFGGSRVSGSGVVVGECGSYLSGLHPSW